MMLQDNHRPYAVFRDGILLRNSFGKRCSADARARRLPRSTTRNVGHTIFPGVGQLGIQLGAMGIGGSRRRFAEPPRIPWGFATLPAPLADVSLGPPPIHTTPTFQFVPI